MAEYEEGLSEAEREQFRVQRRALRQRLKNGLLTAGGIIGGMAVVGALVAVPIVMGHALGGVTGLAAAAASFTIAVCAVHAFFAVVSAMDKLEEQRQRAARDREFELKYPDTVKSWEDKRPGSRDRHVEGAP